MGRKAKRSGAKKAGRDEKAVALARAEGASSSDDDVEGTAGAAAATVLPMANLVRLMRHVIPKGVKISTRAKQLTHDCAVEFVGFVAGEASAQAAAQHRRTIAPEDFTCSFRALGFDDYVQPMTTYIRRYREQHHVAGGYGAFAPSPVPRPPPPPVQAPAVVAAMDDAPCVPDEEMQCLSSMGHTQHEDGEYDEAGSSSACSPTPAEHGDLFQDDQAA